MFSFMSPYPHSWSGAVSLSQVTPLCTWEACTQN